ncbi:MAG TPA: hypothetical protein VKY33_00955 [Flavobacterium sp.]|nr:hypothetical protein [Flavobacterium sp.]
MKEEVNKERLLEKYYNGDTTLAEEQWLKKHVFEAEETVEQLIFKDIDTLKQQHTKSNIPNKKQQNIRMRFITVCSLVAAAVVVLFVWNPLGSYFRANVFETKIGNEILVSNTIEGTIEDPEIALEQAQKALTFVSEKLNTGMENIDHLNKLNQVKE